MIPFLRSTRKGILLLSSIENSSGLDTTDFHSCFSIREKNFMAHRFSHLPIQIPQSLLPLINIALSLSSRVQHPFRSFMTCFQLGRVLLWRRCAVLTISPALLMTTTDTG